MTENRAVIEHTVREGCKSTIEAMAMAKGWTEELTDIGDGWINVRLSRPS
jgi:hypothetical protein